MPSETNLKAGDKVTIVRSKSRLDVFGRTWSTRTRDRRWTGTLIEVDERGGRLQGEDEDGQKIDRRFCPLINGTLPGTYMTQTITRAT